MFAFQSCVRQARGDALLTLNVTVQRGAASGASAATVG